MTCNCGNFGFLLDMRAQLPYKQRQECIRSALTRVQSEVSAVLERKRVMQGMPHLGWLLLEHKLDTEWCSCHRIEAQPSSFECAGAWTSW
jgi:hypothetical protein